MFTAFVLHYNNAGTEKDLSDKKWELIQIIRNFRKMYPQLVEFELYINHIVTELMYGDEEIED